MSRSSRGSAFKNYFSSWQQEHGDAEEFISSSSFGRYEIERFLAISVMAEEIRAKRVRALEVWPMLHLSAMARKVG